MVKKVTNEDIVMLLNEGVVKEQIQTRICLLYTSILASLALSKATDRYVAANQDDLELWLKKCGIQREAR